MKRLLGLLLVLMIMFNSSRAAVGDTTWVQAHSDIWLDHYGGFDTTIQFPDGNTSYRRVYMIFTLGKYTCPGSPQYCGDWDYTVNNYLMTKGGDTIELGRFITPYANAGSPRTPLTWKQRYVFDVTDYYTLLKDSATIRIGYQGYSWGFTANVKFAFVEGTPAREVLAVNRLWNGYFNFGGSPGIDDMVTQQSLTAPANTQFAEMKFNISGHGADNTGCSEFCKKYYQVKLNGTQIEQKDIWRDNCGSNHIYPQSGTWVYDRANWCPGDIVATNTHKLAGITGGTNYNLDVDFENYTSANGGAGYGIDGAVIYYGAFNHAKDISVEDIIAPTDFETHFRENPTSDKPIVEVMNNGSETITSIKLEYKINQGTAYTYIWTGSLAPLAKTKITLPEMPDLRTTTGVGNAFSITATQVNGGADEDASNNTLKSSFTAAAQWPMALIVRLRTNLRANESRWKIVDALDNVVAQRIGTAASTNYLDTLNIGPGSYRLIVEDDGCDGLNWWANAAAGSGILSVRSLSSIVPFQLKGYFNGDFGCGFTEAFNVTWPTAIQQLTAAQQAMQLFPNPANENVHISLTGNFEAGTINIADMAGRIVISRTITAAETDMNVSTLQAGIYQATYISTNGVIKLNSKLIIAK